MISINSVFEVLGYNSHLEGGKRVINIESVDNIQPFKTIIGNPIPLNIDEINNLTTENQSSMSQNDHTMTSTPIKGYENNVSGENRFTDNDNTGLNNSQNRYEQYT